MYKQATKENKNGSSANSVVQKKNSARQGLMDNRPEVVAQRKLQEMANSPQAKLTTQLESMTHAKGCGCSSCITQLVQLKISEPSASVAQLTCDEGHQNHPAGPCRVRDKAAFEAKRDSQSHPQHGGDAKGRAKMYEKRKGEGKQ